MSVRPSWFDVTTRWQMVGSVLRWNPSMIPPELIGAKTVTRAHRMTFFADEVKWRELRSKDLRVTRILRHVGNTSFKQYAVVTLNGEPLFSLTTTVVAVDDSLRSAIVLPKANVMKAAMIGQEPRVQRLRAMPWTAWAAPGGGREHEDCLAPVPVGRRPPDAFRLEATVRWVECDEFGHMSQSQYALLMEEARATAAARGAVPADALADRTPVRFYIDYLGQATAGDQLCIFSWWDGESFHCEMDRQSGDETALVAVSRVWVTADAGLAKL
eukprot:TRINITY_DN65071_c0_g1_i1.p1 TRINITY_DN65071_c0_g1~~TRINITY_DN65071_c0_g1_i1.p1  ORF type:complete len:294 (-),score=48.93 TRINITY_DN65071_c0_g1_i1:32-844(-)